MKKIFAFIAFMLLAFLLTACTPSGSAGKIEVRVYNYESKEVFKGKISFTEEDTLLKLLQDHKDIKLKGEESALGFYILEIKGINANDYEFTFWNVKVNSENSPVGISEIKLVDKDVIEFWLISWQ